MARAKPQKEPGYPRIVTRTGRPSVVVHGLKRGGLRDTYHWLLTISWPWFIVQGAAIYLGVNAVFAWLFWLDPQGIAGARPGSFADAFFFSVETFATIGYGALAPHSAYANILMTVEAFAGIALTAVATGLIFARFSRPTARVMFSRVAVVAPFDGVPTLMFRAANVRTNQVLEAEVSVSMARQVRTVEGVSLRRLYDLPVTRGRQPLFALTWMVMHPIDERSPLFGATPESLMAEQAEIVIVLSGVDETFAARVHARHSYIPGEIVWGRHFEDVLSVTPDGRRIVDYGRFHEVRSEAASSGPG